MTTVEGCDPDRQLIDDLFHALSQPLTSLRCCAEVTLLEPRTPEQYWEVVQQSVELAEKISELVSGIRELYDAGLSYSPGEWIPLQHCLVKMVGDLTPVAEAEGKAIVLSCVPGEAQIEGGVRKGLALMVQQALSLCATGETVKMAAQATSIQICVPRMISDPHCEGKTSTLQRRLRVAIARRRLEAAGCVCREQQVAEGWSYEVLLPVEWARGVRESGKVFPFPTPI